MVKPKNYYKRGNRFVVVKTICGKRITFCRVETERAAKRAVKLCDKYKWNKEKYFHKVMAQLTVEGLY